MSNVIDKPCTVLIPGVSLDDSLKEMDLVKMLESNEDDTKIRALKLVIVRTLNGETFPKMLMAVIKSTLHSPNHYIKKLVMIFWEVTNRKNAQGKLVDEMILVVNALKLNLTHPNEYVRGNTLRFLTKIRDPEIIESLVPSIYDNLTHRHSYVRKLAVMCVFAIYESTPDLVSDAPEKLEEMLRAEQHAAAKRNLFLFFLHCDPLRAVPYLNEISQSPQQVLLMGESVRLVILELMRKVGRAQPQLRGNYIRCIHDMLDSDVPAVAYEAANTLLALTAAPTAVRAAAGTYCRLLKAENNVKLFLLDRLVALRKRHGTILRDFMMDILAVIQTPSTDVRVKALALALELVTVTSIDALVTMLKKELARIEGQQEEDHYRRLLVDALHRCAVKFPSVVPAVAPALVAFLSDDATVSPSAAGTGTAAAAAAAAGAGNREAAGLAASVAASRAARSIALEAVLFLREIMEEHPQLRAELLSRITDAVASIRAPDVFRGALWILGEYGGEVADVAWLAQAIDTVLAAVGPLPFPTPTAGSAKSASSTASGASDSSSSDTDASSSSSSTSSSSSSSSSTSTPKPTFGPTVLADGTYASSSSAPASVASTTAARPTLRSMLLQGDFFLASALAVCVTKLLLSLRLRTPPSAFGPELRRLDARTLHLLASLLKYGNASAALAAATASSSGLLGSNIATLASSASSSSSTPSPQETAAPKALESDAAERIRSCLLLLLQSSDSWQRAGVASGDPNLFGECRSASRIALADHRKRQATADRQAGSSAAGAGVGSGGSSSAAISLASALAAMAHTGDDTPAAPAAASSVGGLAALALDDGASSTKAAQSGLLVLAEVDSLLKLRLLTKAASAGGAGGAGGEGDEGLDWGGEPDGGLHLAITGQSKIPLDLSKQRRSLRLAAGSAASGSGAPGEGAKLKNVHQLTGFSDPIYAEALVKVLEFDLLVEFTLVNQTNVTLQNVTLELHTSADLRVLDRPQPINMAPFATHTLRSAIKVTTTDSGVIFGNLVYDSPNGSEKTIMMLNTMQLDVIDYIRPATCADVSFRCMWAEFEWENKVAVTTDITDINEYLQHIVRITNMRCLTPPDALRGACNFLAANLYARSVFGEDALMNLSVERQEGGKLGGYVRIRSQIQGIALGLGDKIAAKQRLAA